MKKLRDFYEYEGRLLHAAKDFLGYDPMISIPLHLPDFKKPGEGKQVQCFTVGGNLFEAVISGGLFYGPIRGYKQAEVFKWGELVICTRKGGNGHGGNYLGGQNFHIEGNRALMVVEGYAMKDFKAGVIHGGLDPEAYYLLVFEGIIIPVQYPQSEAGPATEKELYLRRDLEPHRQMQWEGCLELPYGTLSVACSGVPGFGVRSSDGRTTVYKRVKGWDSLKRKELSIAGKTFLFEDGW